MSHNAIVIKTVKQAGKIIQQHYKKQDAKIISKGILDIVTSADKKVEDFYIKTFSKEFPEYNFLSEEVGLIKENHSNYLWVIDPLDGTKNFSFKNPIFATSVALLYLPDYKINKNAEIVLGVTYAPVLNELYVAEKGKPFYLNNKSLKVSKKQHLEEAVNAFCHGSKKKDFVSSIKMYKQLKTKSLAYRQLGAASVELGYVAAGRIESIAIPGINPWDAAAGVLMVRQAGGKVTDFEGREWNMTSKDMLASNGKIHEALLKQIKFALK